MGLGRFAAALLAVLTNLHSFLWWNYVADFGPLQLYLIFSIRHELVQFVVHCHNSEFACRSPIKML